MRNNVFNVQSIQEGITVGNMERSMLITFASLENTQAYHQDSLVMIKGMINNHPISILIDLGEIMSYISPRIIQLCKLVPEKFDKSWMVQLST